MESFSLPPYICVSLISGKNRLGGSGIHVSPPQDRHICVTAVAMVWSVRNCSGYGLECEKLQWLWFGVWETAVAMVWCVRNCSGYGLECEKLRSRQAVFSTSCVHCRLCSVQLVSQLSCVVWMIRSGYCGSEISHIKTIIFYLLSERYTRWRKCVILRNSAPPNPFS